MSAFMGDDENNDYINKNRLGLRLPKDAVSFLTLADDIEKVGVRWTTENVTLAATNLAIIKLAYDTFGHRMEQLAMYNPRTIGPMTLRFIKETEALVFDNVPRDIDIRTWDGLLDGPDLTLSLVNVVSRVSNNETKNVSYYDREEETVKLSTPRSRERHSSSEYLVLWAARPNGIMDMLHTLQHCYGKQSLARRKDVPQE